MFKNSSNSWLSCGIFCRKLNLGYLGDILASSIIIQRVWRLRRVDRGAEDLLVKELGISRMLARVLVARDIKTPGCAQKFLSLSLKDLADPFLLPDMQGACTRLERALREGEVIFVYGDSDADGISSTAIMVKFLRSVGGKVKYKVPSRDKEGYGLTKEVVNEAKEEANIILTVDCGISSREAIVYAKSLGLDVIVCDHHIIRDIPPAYAVIYPNETPFSGSGMAFELCLALRRKLRDSGWFGEQEPNLKSFLGYVAIGTIGDIVPLISDNRIFVKFGLSVLKDIPGFENIVVDSAEDVQMKIVPRINSAGRMGNPSLALELMLTGKQELAQKLERMNEERKRTTKEHLERIEVEDKDAIVVWGEELNEGILGLMASNIMARYSRPVCVLSLKGDIATGSVRSPEILDVMGVLVELQDILIKFGGHSHAAGISLKTSDIEEFSRRFTEVVRSVMKGRKAQPKLWVDASFELDKISARELEEVMKIEPCGEGNPRPVFMVSAYVKSSRRIGKDHLELTLEGNQTTFRAIGFGMGEKDSVNGRKLLVLSPRIWQGRIEFEVKDIL